MNRDSRQFLLRTLSFPTRFDVRISRWSRLVHIFSFPGQCSHAQCITVIVEARATDPRPCGAAVKDNIIFGKNPRCQRVKGMSNTPRVFFMTLLSRRRDDVTSLIFRFVLPSLLRADRS
jgi:hypothetical protein